MMPSRGLHIARTSSPRLLQPQCRNLSSSHLHLRTATFRSTFQAPSQIWRKSTPVAISSLAAVRHASWYTFGLGKKEAEAAPFTQTAQPPPPQAVETTTLPQTAPPATAATTTPASETASFPNLDSITLDNINIENLDGHISNIQEGIGYLHQIGIDHGWGPRSMIQWILEHMHIYGGLPWWGSIAATALLLRIVMLPLYIKSSDSQARQAALTSVMAPITKRMSDAQKAGDAVGVRAAWGQLNTVRSRAGISMTAQFMPPIVQGVLGYCGFTLMRELSVLPVPGFLTGGFLWMQDLTVADGWLILPALMAGSIHMLIRMGGESGATQTQQLPPMIQKFMLWGLPTMTFAFISFQPGAVCVWFAVSGLLGMAQGQILQRPSVRRYLSIAPLYTPKPSEGSANPFNAWMEERMGKLNATNTASAANNASYMKPAYQSPNLNSTTMGRTMDTTLVTPERRETSTTVPEMIQPGVARASPGPKSGILDKVTKSSHEAKKFSEAKKPNEAKKAAPKQGTRRK